METVNKLRMHSQASRFPVELGTVRDPDAQVGRLHRLALAGGPCWGLARLLRRGEIQSEKRTSQHHGATTSIDQFITGSYVVAATCCVPRSMVEMGYRVNLASGSPGTKYSQSMGKRFTGWDRKPHSVNHSAERWERRPLETGMAWAKALVSK